MTEHFIAIKKGKEEIRVKDGVCWWAVFGWLWSWNRHLGWQTGLWLFFGSYLLAPLANIYYIIRGNGWILEKYLNEGYIPVTPITAHSWTIKRSLKRHGYDNVTP